MVRDWLALIAFSLVAGITGGRVSKLYGPPWELAYWCIIAAVLAAYFVARERERNS